MSAGEWETTLQLLWLIERYLCSKGPKAESSKLRKTFGFDHGRKAGHQQPPRRLQAHLFLLHNKGEPENDKTTPASTGLLINTHSHNHNLPKQIMWTHLLIVPDSIFGDSTFIGSSSKNAIPHSSPETVSIILDKTLQVLTSFLLFIRIVPHVGPKWHILIILDPFDQI